MKSNKHQVKQYFIDTVTQRLVTSKMAKDQISNIPFMVGIAMAWYALTPPHSLAKLLVALGVEMVSIIWAGWLYISWKRRCSVESTDSDKVYAWAQFRTLLYHLARATMFLPCSLGMLTVSLLIFAYLQIKPIQILLAIGYGLAAFTLLANQDRLLEISVSGVQNETWERLRSCLMAFGIGAAGAGTMLGRIIARSGSKSLGLGAISVCSSVIAIMTLYYGFLDFSITRAFITKGAWRRE